MFGSMYEKYFATSFRANALLSSSTSCHTSDSIADVVISSALERAGAFIITHIAILSIGNSFGFIAKVHFTGSSNEGFDSALPTARFQNRAHLLPCLFGAYILLAAAFRFSIASINGAD